MIEAGEGQYANPASILKALELLLRHIGKTGEAHRLAAAIQDAEKNVVMTGHSDGATASQFTDWVIRSLGSESTPFPGVTGQ